MVRTLRLIARARTLASPTSPSFLKTVPIRENTCAYGSNIQWRGRSNALSVTSDTSNPQKGRKRLSKDARQALVEAYVNKYMEANAGKFPTVTNVKSHVGGGYYVLRKIMQELEHKSKLHSSNIGGEMMKAKDLSKEGISLAQAQVPVRKKNVDAQETVDPTAAVANDKTTKSDVAATRSAFSSQADLRAHSEPHDAMEVDNTEEIREDTSGSVVESNFLNEGSKDKSHQFDKLQHRIEKYPFDLSDVTSDSPFANAEVEESSSYVNQAEKDLEQKVQEEKQYPERSTIEHREHADSEAHWKSSLWGNLKSLADGIIGFWRKR